MPRCKVGDMAIVIRSAFEENVGLTVKVISPAKSVFRSQMAWSVESSVPIMFFWQQDLTQSCAGSANVSIFGDDDLQPIRGTLASNGDQTSRDIKTKAPEKCNL